MSTNEYEDGRWKMEDGKAPSGGADILVCPRKSSANQRLPFAAIPRHLPSSIFHPRLLLVLATALLGCASPRREEPLAGPLPLADPNLVAGRQVFMANCYECHPGGSAGLGPALNDKPLPAFAIRTQVRKGFGAMPAFDESKIPQPDLDNVVAYLQMLRSHKPAER